MLQLIAARARAGPGRRRHHPAQHDDHRRALHAGGAAAHAGALQRRLGRGRVVLGPLVGGYITDALSWRWVFYINIPFGLLCVAVIASAYPASRVRIAGAGGLAGRGAAVRRRQRAAHRARRRDRRWCRGGRGAAGAVRAPSSIVERAHAEPILPVDLLRYPVIVAHAGVVFLVGFALFGAIAFVPLFVQAVMGGTATEAGQVLTPLFLGWVTMSVIGAKVTVSSATAWWRLPAAC